MVGMEGNRLSSSRTNPILVTGAHRCGSTFVGKMLALPVNIGYLEEPFNRRSGIKGINTWFFYVKKGLQDETNYCYLLEQVVSGQASYKMLISKSNLKYMLTKQGQGSHPSALPG